MIQGLCVLAVFLFAGDCVSAALSLPIPGNVIGMALLALALNRRLVAEDVVRPAAGALTRNMAFFFVPAGVGVVEYGGLLRREWLPIVVACVVSTLAVQACAGYALQRAEARA